MSMGELAAALGIDRPSATVLVDDLESLGLVRRRPHPTDRRAKVVEATRKGTAMARQADEISVPRRRRSADWAPMTSKRSGGYSTPSAQARKPAGRGPISSLRTRGLRENTSEERSRHVRNRSLHVHVARRVHRRAQ
jgi:DNA-binding MarR family transcriptional regulator